MVMMKSEKLDKNQSMMLIKNFLDHFQKIMSSTKSISISDLEKYLSQKFHITHNGQLLASNLTEYMKHVELLHKKFSHFHFAEQHAEPLASGNKMVVHYELLLNSRSGQKIQVHIMALATIEDNKISSWMEVTNVEGTPSWNA